MSQWVWSPRLCRGDANGRRSPNLNSAFASTHISSLRLEQDGGGQREKRANETQLGRNEETEESNISGSFGSGLQPDETFIQK